MVSVPLVLHSIPHSFGIYGQCAPFPLVAFARSTEPQYQCFWGGYFIIAMVAGSLIFAICLVGAAFHLTLIWAITLMWGQRGITADYVADVAVYSPPWWVPLIIERFVSAGRASPVPVRPEFPLHGRYGKTTSFSDMACNYMEALHDYNKPVIGADYNVFLLGRCGNRIVWCNHFLASFCRIMRLWRL